MRPASAEPGFVPDLYVDVNRALQLRLEIEIDSGGLRACSLNYWLRNQSLSKPNSAYTPLNETRRITFDKHQADAPAAKKAYSGPHSSFTVICASLLIWLATRAKMTTWLGTEQ